MKLIIKKINAKVEVQIKIKKIFNKTKLWKSKIKLLIKEEREVQVSKEKSVFKSKKNKKM